MPTIQESMKRAADDLKRGAPTPEPTPEKARKDGETITEWIGRQFNNLFERTKEAEASVPPTPVEPKGYAPSHAPPSLEPAAVKPSGKETTGVSIEDYAFTKDAVNRLSGSHRIALAGWAKLYRQGQMSDDDLKRQLEITFEPYVKKKANPDGFLDLKGFRRAVNAEMAAIKKLKPID